MLFAIAALAPFLSTRLAIGAFFVWSVMRNPTLNALFPTIAVLIWSVNVIVNKLSASVIDPAAISFYRWLLAFLVMTPFMLPTLRQHAATIRQHAQTAGFGSAWHGVVSKSGLLRGALDQRRDDGDHGVTRAATHRPAQHSVAAFWLPRWACCSVAYCRWSGLSG